LCGELYGGLLGELDRGIGAAYPTGIRLLDAVPTGSAGVAMALARYASAQGGRDFDPVARIVVDPTTPGTLLGATAAAASMGQPLPDAGAVLDIGPNPPRSTDLLNRAEVALTAFRATNDEMHRASAHAAVRTLLARRRGKGRWFPDRRRPDRMQLSAVDGVAAVGLACLALAEEDVTSLRLIS
jgi:hypothetical protein